MNLKQILFKSYYTAGETEGNCEQSMLKAGYKRGYARKSAGRYIKATKGMQKAIAEMLEAVKIAWEDRVSKVITRAQGEMDKTESIPALCLLMNAQKGYMDMQAKNEGKYGADNAQRTEEAKLTAVQVEEAKKYAKWRLVQDLRVPEVKGKPGEVIPLDGPPPTGRPIQAREAG